MNTEYKTEEKMILATYNKHIDNGGISLIIEKGEYGITVSYSTQYFGYPSIKSIFEDFSYLMPEDLIDIGNKFIEAAIKMKDLKNEAKKE